MKTLQKYSATTLKAELFSKRKKMQYLHFDSNEIQAFVTKLLKFIFSGGHFPLFLSKYHRWGLSHESDLSSVSVKQLNDLWDESRSC